MSELAEFMVHEVQVETYLGQGSLGARYSAPAAVPCFLEEGDHLISGPDGAKITAKAAFFVVNPSSWGALLPRSKVTLRAGVTNVIASAIARSSGDLDLPDHMEVHLV